MRSVKTMAFGAAMVAAVGSAQAASLDIRHAALRVTVIPEARADIGVAVVKANPRMKVRMLRVGDKVVIDGGLGFRNADCVHQLGRRGVRAWGLGFVPYDDLPHVVVRTPLNARISAGGAVFGTVDRAASLQLENAGCGDWSVANVAGPLTVRLAGSGDVHAGSVGAATVRISGSSDVFIKAVRNGLDSSAAGSGNLHADAISGPLHVRVAGSGDVTIPSGQVTDMVVGVAGSGDVRFGGVARSLDASILGSGDVVVGRVVGGVSKRIAGSGTVTIGG